MKWTVLFACCFGLAISQYCRTPFGESSRCVALNACPTLLGAIRRKPVPSITLDFLRASSCGYYGSQPYVCCSMRLPYEDQFQEPQPPPPPPSRPTRPTVSAGSAPAVREDSQPAPSGQCGIESNGDKIFDGEVTDLGEFPWMALLGYRSRSGSLLYQCGGVLVNRRYIMTAAHCVTGEILDKVGTPVTVRLGEHDTRTDVDCIDLGGNSVCAEPHVEIPIERVIPHPGYHKKNINVKDDIALVRLAQRASYSPYIQAICLGNGNTRLSNGENLYAAGWGKTLSGSYSNTKLKLRLPIFDKASCINIYRKANAILTDNQLCAGGMFAKDSCKGDSGGPLMRITNQGTWEAYGNISFGAGCGLDGVPGVYTSVPSYLDWIRNTMVSTNSQGYSPYGQYGRQEFGVDGANFRYD